MRIQSFKTVVSVALTLGAALVSHAQVFFDFSGGLPAGTALFGNAQITGGALHLTDTVYGTNGHFRISNIGDGKAVKAATIHWKSLIGGGDGADGYSLNWATDLPASPAFDSSEEGSGSGLTVTVDTFDNGGGEAPGIEIRWQSNLVAFAAVPKDDPGGGATFLRKNTFVDAELTVDKHGEARFDYDGIGLTAVLDGWKGIKGGDILLSARTGGANDNHWIDNLSVATGIFTAGAFNGLFADGAVVHEKSGFVSVKLTAKGTFSGFIILGGKRYPIRSAFSPTNLTTAINISRPGFTTLTVNLTLIDRDTIVGEVTDGIWSSELQAKRQVWHKTKNPALSYVGNYTAIVSYGTAGEPQGFGYGTLKVDLAGVLKFVGKLGEGSPVAQTVPVAPDGKWPFFCITHRGNGSIQGLASVTNGAVRIARPTWFKGAAAGGPLYGDGFKFAPFMFVSPYVAPAADTRIVDISTGTFAFQAGNLTSSFTNDVVLTTANAIINLDDNRLTVNFKKPNGSFTGTVKIPASTVVIKFAGVLGQGFKAGAGHFIGQTESGRVLFTGPTGP